MDSTKTTIKPESVEILCATMNQVDFSKLGEMNIGNCDVVFANQADAFSYDEVKLSGNTAKMVTTPTRGVGKNRNFALGIASGDILLLADDDLRYEPDYAETVKGAFRQLPDADVILFGLKYAKAGEIFKTRLPETRRLSFIRALRYGTCSIAVRRTSVMKHNLRFSELFGGGCLYSYGEDTDFIVQCFKSRLRIYSYQAVVATTSKDASTCYAGYGEKYFFDKGALARHSLGAMAFPYMLRMACKKTDSEIGALQRIACLWRGYRCFPSLISYEEWRSNRARDEEDNHRQ